MKRLLFSLPCVFIIFVVAAFFYKSIVYGLIPAPTDALVGLYHPWRDSYAATNPRGVPFKNFLITDPVRQQIPWRKISMDQLGIGQMPSWNPYTFLGAPLSANIQAGIYQPANILFSLFNFPTAWTLLIMLQPLCSALFLYLYLRNLKMSNVSSSVGALIWAFSGFSIAWLTWGTIGWVAAFIPLVLYGIDKARNSFLGKDLSFTPLIHGSLVIIVASIFMVASGHAQIALYGLVVSCLYGLYRLLGVKKRKETFLFVCISLTAILAGSYVVWHPFVRFYLSTTRSIVADLSAVSGWLMPVKHLVQFFVPDFFGNPTTLNYYGVWNYGEMIGYIGIVPIILALSALFVTGVTMFWSWVCVVSLILMIHSPLTTTLYSLHIPIFSSLQPTRLMVLVDLSLAILAAYGMEAFLTKKHKRLYISYVVVASVFVVLALIVSYLRSMSVNPETVSQMAISMRNLVLPAILFLGFGIVLIAHKVIKKHAALIMTLCIILFSLVDLFRFGWKFTPFTPREYFFPITKTISFLQSQTKPFRVMSLDDRILPPNSSGYYSIETIEGYDPLYPADYVSFLYGNASNNIQSLQRIFTLHDINNPVLPYLNVRYVLSLDEIQNPDFVKVFEEGQTKIYKYMKGFDRVYLSSHDVVTAKSYMKDTIITLRDGVAKEGMRTLDGTTLARTSANEFASITAYSDNAITIRTSTDTERTVVILNRYDTGWHANMDDTPVPIFRANGLFQGIDVPKGDHVLELRYISL